MNWGKFLLRLRLDRMSLIWAAFVPSTSTNKSLLTLHCSPKACTPRDYPVHHCSFDGTHSARHNISILICSSYVRILLLNSKSTLQCWGKPIASFRSKTKFCQAIFSICLGKKDINIVFGALHCQEYGKLIMFFSSNLPSVNTLPLGAHRISHMLC